MAKSEGSSGQLIRGHMLALSRSVKQAIMAFADAAGAGLCVFAALWASGSATGAGGLSIAILVIFAVLVLLPLNLVFGLYRSVIRFLGAGLFLAALKATTIAAMVVGIGDQLASISTGSIRFTFVLWALLLITVSGTRFAARLFLNRRRVHREQVLIYGAGAAGVRLSAVLSAGDDYLPIAFVDDSRSLWGKVVGGLEVHSPDDIRKLTGPQGAQRVLLALPSIGRRRKRRVLEKLVEMPVHVQTMPEIADIVAGRARVDDIREVDVEDLLGRDAVPPNPELLTACVENRVVMVTGAGGSIGSELCRQILALGPKSLILLEVSEVALYSIDRQLRKQADLRKIDSKIMPLLGSVHHLNRVREIMKTFGVETVYHAAAYKHVPLVEQNVVEGVHNNVFGTLNTAKAAIDAGVDTFVLISTDKAVSPTNVMGATKRFSELILQALHHNNTNVRFCMVRFGNVLASSGSVVPLFREQIRNGGPVTVTHPEIIRYFMTIPEAAQLVIQAGSMARGGDVFVLDMGKPVKILDLAQRMIHLMGLTVQREDNPDGDIEIRFTGLRPAEKLFEELLIGTDVSGTEHPRILRANEDYLAPEKLNPMIDELWDSARALDSARARGILLRAVSGYAPTNGVEDLVWVEKNAAVEEDLRDKVTNISSYRD